MNQFSAPSAATQEVPIAPDAARLTHLKQLEAESIHIIRVNLLRKKSMRVRPQLSNERQSAREWGQLCNDLPCSALEWPQSGKICPLLRGKLTTAPFGTTAQVDEFSP